MSNPNQVVVSQISDVTTVEITTQGPQGPGGNFHGSYYDNDFYVGPQGIDEGGLGDLEDIFIQLTNK